MRQSANNGFCAVGDQLFKGSVSDFPSDQEMNFGETLEQLGKDI